VQAGSRVIGEREQHAAGTVVRGQAGVVGGSHLEVLGVGRLGVAAGCLPKAACSCGRSSCQAASAAICCGSLGMVGWQGRQVSAQAWKVFSGAPDVGTDRR
jgi:hypothetical protein